MEKPLQVFWNGKPLRKIYPHATWFQVMKFKARRFFRKLTIATTIVASFALVSYVSYLYGAYSQPKIPFVEAKDTQYPILDKIADCETGTRLSNGKAVKGSATHYSKSGQVVMTGNNNKSVDVGKYAINSVWFKKAGDMGLDITKEKDNYMFASWIYKNRGTGDWSASANCWKN